MARPLMVREEARQRLRAAVQSVEARTCAEIVIAVRPWSQSWLGIDLLVGAVLAYLALLFMLFTPLEFALDSIAIVVLLTFVMGQLLSRSVPGLRRRLGGVGRMRAAAERGARASFVELGVSHTRERSGVLIYVSLTEGECVVIPDVGVKARVPHEEWLATVATVEASISSHGTGEPGLAALCKAVEALGPRLEACMPRAADDINELEDVA